MWWSAILLLLLPIAEVLGDCFLHVPRGSNNRLDGNGRERKTNNRLFDSQNNNRGGYNVGGDANRRRDLSRIFNGVVNKKTPGVRAFAEETSGPAGKMKYYEGSVMQVSWTNQHQCGGNNSQCELILQYMCDKNLRDGFVRGKIPNVNRCRRSENGIGRNCDTDRRFGMHENPTYYTSCKLRQRNNGLYTADQKLRGDTAIFTRQNRNGQRSGYECPEERDYYPYWAPTPWIDIAVMTNNISRCDDYISKSENVQPRYYCDMSEKKNVKVHPITEKKCLQSGGKWLIDSSRRIHKAPICISSPKSRDNHNGNGPNGFPNSFNWTLPNIPHNNCVLRLRYNISSRDNELFGESEKLINEEAIARGFVFKNNPVVKPLTTTKSGKKLKLRLAINTAQIGRTFQDRSHAFSILNRTEDLINKTIYNMEVQGKRGNIVQVYPAVEYDYGPNRLVINETDYVHFQWTGSDTNPANNAGNGKAGSDRSNMVLLKEKNYAEGKDDNADLTNGHWGNSYPANLSNTENKTLLGLSLTDRKRLALAVTNYTRSPFVCERSTMSLVCPKLMEIRIIYANYGRRFPSFCRTNRKTVQTGICLNHFNSMGVANTKCNGKPSCRLRAINRVFQPDKCKNIPKYLEVTYACVLKSDLPSGSLQNLDEAHPYFNLGPRQLSKVGEYNYMCTRNNNFSNRSQKGRIIIVKPKPEKAIAKKELVDFNGYLQDFLLDF